MATADLGDMAIIMGDGTFGNRVLAALTLYCSTTVQSEVTSTTLTASVHQARKNYAAQVLNNPTFYKPFFVNAVAVNQIAANDACAGGTLVGLTPTQVTAAITSATPTTTGMTDTDINNAVAAAFNAFIAGI